MSDKQINPELMQKLLTLALDPSAAEGEVQNAASALFRHLRGCEATLADLRGALDVSTNPRPVSPSIWEHFGVRATPTPQWQDHVQAMFNEQVRRTMEENADAYRKHMRAAHFAPRTATKNPYAP